MRKTIKVSGGKFTLIRCDGFQLGKGLARCESVFKARSTSMQKNINEARKLGWVIGKKDHCNECHQTPITFSETMRRGAK